MGDRLPEDARSLERCDERVRATPPAGRIGRVQEEARWRLFHGGDANAGEYSRQTSPPVSQPARSRFEGHPMESV